jgi:hypothetical protein
VSATTTTTTTSSHNANEASDAVELGVLIDLHSRLSVAHDAHRNKLKPPVRHFAARPPTIGPAEEPVDSTTAEAVVQLLGCFELCVDVPRGDGDEPLPAM